MNPAWIATNSLNGFTGLWIPILEAFRIDHCSGFGFLCNDTVLFRHDIGAHGNDNDDPEQHQRTAREREFFSLSLRVGIFSPLSL